MAFDTIHAYLSVSMQFYAKGIMQYFNWLLLAYIMLSIAQEVFSLDESRETIEDYNDILLHARITGNHLEALNDILTTQLLPLLEKDQKALQLLLVKEHEENQAIYQFIESCPFLQHQNPSSSSLKEYFLDLLASSTQFFMDDCHIQNHLQFSEKLTDQSKQLKNLFNVEFHPAEEDPLEIYITRILAYFYT